MAEQETKQDLITQAKGLGAPDGGFSLRPRTFDEAFRFANLMAESDLLPKEFRGSPANVLVAVQLGMELGVSPMQALQNIYVVNGRPAIFGDLLPAIVFQSGLLESIHEEGDETQAKCTVKRKGHDAISRTFTWEDAKRATAMEYGKQISLAEKQTYKSYPKRMLQMRARALALRDMFPDVLKGVAVREEAEDFIETTATTETEPPKPIAIPQPAKKEAASDNQPRGAAAEMAESGAGESTGSPGPKLEEVPSGNPARADPTPTDQAASTEEAKPPDEPKVTKGKRKKTDEQADRPAEEVEAGSQGDGADRTEVLENEAPAGELAIEDKLLHWIQTASDEEIGQKVNLFTQSFNEIDKSRQMELLRPYNKRRQALVKQ